MCCPESGTWRGGEHIFTCKTIPFYCAVANRLVRAPFPPAGTPQPHRKPNRWAQPMFSGKVWVQPAEVGLCRRGVNHSGGTKHNPRRVLAPVQGPGRGGLCMGGGARTQMKGDAEGLVPGGVCGLCIRVRVRGLPVGSVCGVKPPCPTCRAGA